MAQMIIDGDFAAITTSVYALKLTGRGNGRRGYATELAVTAGILASSVAVTALRKGGRGQWIGKQLLAVPNPR